MSNPRKSAHLAISRAIAGRDIEQVNAQKHIERQVPDTLAQQGLSVLVAEDHPVNQELIHTVLKKLGCKSTLADNGAVAFERYMSNRFDLILMDCQMPIMDGYEATRKIRQLEAENHLPAIPIIAMTANALSGDRERCIEEGMSDYIAKPFKQQALVTLINQYFPNKTPAPVEHTEPASGSEGATEADGDARTLPARNSDEAPQVPAETEAAFDLSTLKETTDDDPALMAMLIERYLTTQQQDLTALETAWQGSRFDEVKKIAHKMKGAALMMGAVDFASDCKTLEMHDFNSEAPAAPLFEHVQHGSQQLCEKMAALKLI